MHRSQVVALLPVVQVGLLRRRAAGMVANSLGQLDLAAVAKRIGVSRQWVIEIERGHARAELGLVLRALDALSIRLEHGRAAIKAFLWSLLPDDERVLDRWATNFQVSARNVFALLSAQYPMLSTARRLVDPTGHAER